MILFLTLGRPISCPFNPSNDTMHLERRSAVYGTLDVVEPLL